MKIDQTITDVITRSTKDTFSKCFSINVTPVLPVQTSGKEIRGDYTATIVIIQESVEVRVSLSFDDVTLREMLKDTYTEEELSDSEIVKDALSELLNIIYGAIKTELNKRGYNFKITIPIVIVGVPHRLHQLHKGINITIPFHYKQHKFYINLTLQEITDDFSLENK